MDEDQIEATIRRVAEAKAAREGGAPMPEAATAPMPELPVAPEQPRYGQESADGPAPAPDESAIEDTIRRVQAARAGMAHNAPATQPVAERPVVEESTIEAAIRRVAEAKVLRDCEETAEVAQAPAAAEEAPAPESDPAPVRPTLLYPARAPWQTPRLEPVGSESELAQAVAQLRQELDETKRALEALTARFEALQAPGAAADATAEDGRGEWYDPPAIPRAAPALVRDFAPQNGGSERAALHDERPRVIDTRPIPKPLPPLHAEPKRGLDLLPRTYRITVEDKRRGVDLVPLHRALLGMDGVRDMSLLSYSNGVAIVSLEVVNELNAETLGRAVARAMSRETKVEVHNEQTMVVKLAEE